MNASKQLHSTNSRQRPYSRSCIFRPYVNAGNTRCAPPGAGGFLSGLSKVLGGGKGTSTEPPSGGAEQRSTVDTLLTPSQAAKPVFPPYTVVRKTGDYALRFYNVFPVVEMEYQRREEGYASLGAYIDGGNSAGTRFAYSQPVVMCYFPDGRKVMQMFVGGRADAAADSAGALSVASLPAPREPSVRLNVSGGELVAVLQFEGYITPATAESARQRLMACLKRDGIQLSDTDQEGRFRCAQYGAVYQLGDRLNELMLQVKV